MKIRFGLLTVAAAVVAALTFLATIDAEARAGRGSSAGIRGSSTSPFTAPRTTAPTQQATRPAATAAQPGMAPRSPFVSGLMGGLLGAGIGALLFGNMGNFFGEGAAGFMGLMLQLAIVGGLAYLLISWLRRRSQRQLAAAGAGPEGSFRTAEFELAGSRDAAVPALPAAVQLGDADYETFTAMLTEIQRAWSRGDMNAAAGWLSDDMQAHFTGLLAEDKAAGRRNVDSDVVLLKGDLVESWREDGAEWATVEMRWQALDYTVDAKDGQVIEGSALDPVEASERWTLVRRAGGGWKLAGIDQA